MDVTVLDGTIHDDADTSADRLLGLTCFETIAFHDGALQHAEAHLERLAQSARTLGLGPQGGWEAVDEALQTALDATRHEDGIVRVSLHATGTPTGLQLEEPRAEVQVTLTKPRYGDLSQGVSVVTSTFQAPHEDAWPSHVKAPCLPRYLAHREARARDAFEALLLDASENVVSGTRSNLFLVLDDTVLTPPTPPAFPGVTRRRVLDALPAEATTVRRVDRSELDDASEAWLSFTGPGIVPVLEIDGHPVGSPGPGPWTKRARNELNETST